MGRSALWLYKRFNTIVDRTGDPSIEDWELTEGYNLSALSEFKDQFGNEHNTDPNGTVPYSWEMTDTDTVKWQPLIKTVTLSTDVDGKLFIAAIETAITGKIFHISFNRRSATDEDRYVRFVRHNDIGIQQQNIFKKATDRYPVFNGFEDYFQLIPGGIRAVQMTVIKYPSEIVLDFANPGNDQPTDLTDSAIDDVLWRLAAQYGIATREQQLVQDATMEENKK